MGKPAPSDMRRLEDRCAGPAVATSGPSLRLGGAAAPSAAFGLDMRMLAAGPAHRLTVLLLKRPVRGDRRFSTAWFGRPRADEPGWPTGLVPAAAIYATESF
jgi:hypothetical protein